MYKACFSCKRGDTAKADQVKAKLRDITPGVWSGVAGKSAKNASLIGEADSDEALKENII